MERHGRMAPDCPWVILSFPHTQHALSMPENAKSTRLSTARVHTFKKNTQWPPISMTRKNLPTAKKVKDNRNACIHINYKYLTKNIWEF